MKLKLVGPFGALLVLLCCSLFPAVAVAQSITGTISVLATDSSGAVVNDASVLVRNTDTNITRSITTNSEGRALIQGLPVGPYEVTVEKPGFGRIVRSGIILQLNQDAVVNAALKPTAVSETVVVTEDAPLLNTTTSEVGVRFDE